MLCTPCILRLLHHFRGIYTDNAISKILTLYAQRPIVEKHARYALYHPSCEAIASMLTDLPYKICNALIFNLTFYFMVNPTGTLKISSSTR